MFNPGINDGMIAFNKYISQELKGEKYKLFENKIRNNSEFMDMKDLIPAVLKKADSPARKKVIKEIEGVVKEFKGRLDGK